LELYHHTPNMPSWRGAQLKHRDNFIFTVIKQAYACSNDYILWILICAAQCEIAYWSSDTLLLAHWSENQEMLRTPE